jgi:hypothetical protein
MCRVVQDAVIALAASCAQALSSIRQSKNFDLQNFPSSCRRKQRVGCVSFVSHCKTILAIFSILIHTVSSFTTDFQFSWSGITFSAYWLIKAWFVQWRGKAGVQWYEASQCAPSCVYTARTVHTTENIFYCSTEQSMSY